MPEVGSATVLSWGVGRLRDLPWRATRDPWAVLVAEVMLQQTQTARVVPKWQAFLGHFPTPTDLAAAPLGDVLRRWEGLGYPRRARNLHTTAAIVVERFGGLVPPSLDDLLGLPGVGAYTARAVRAFAFECDAAVVDTNVARVLARSVGRRLTPGAAQAEADRRLPPGEAWAWNQIMLDLGATVCRPRNPACGECPLSGRCAWRRAGHPDPDPAIGSAGVSGVQAPFEGSDRQARGRLLRAMSRRPVRLVDLPASAGLVDDPVRAGRLADALVGEGLVAVSDDGTYSLP